MCLVLWSRELTDIMKRTSGQPLRRYTQVDQGRMIVAFHCMVTRVSMKQESELCVKSDETVYIVKGAVVTLIYSW